MVTIPWRRRSAGGHVIAPAVAVAAATAHVLAMLAVLLCAEWYSWNYYAFFI